MKQRLNLILKIFFDICSIIIALIVAYSLKFKLGALLSKYFSSTNIKIYSTAQIEPYIANIFLIISIMLFSFLFLNVYKKQTGLLPIVDECLMVTKGITFLTFTIMAMSFITNFFPESKFVLAYMWVFSILFMTTHRLIINFFFNPSNIKTKNIIIIGLTDTTQLFLEKVVEKRLPYHCLGVFYEKKPENLLYTIQNKFNHLGSFAHVENFLKEHDVDEVFFASHGLSSKLLDSLIYFCIAHNITHSICIYKSKLIEGLSTSNNFDGIATIGVEKLTTNHPHLFFKRIFDIIFSSIALVLLFPLLLIVCLWIKCVSPHGPIIYAQERSGLNNKRFLMYKFRTMQQDAESSTGPTWVSETNETRYIKGGKWLRKTSIDELPQFFNILKNDMSIVGPRPERPFFIDEIKKTVPHFNLRHKFKGGLTGWAQLNGRAYLTDKPHYKIKYDLYYIKNWSLIFDFKIMIKTFFILIKGDKAY